MRMVRSKDIDAQAWVHRLGVLSTIAWAVETFLAFVAGAAAGVPLVALVPAGITALWGWLTVDWRLGKTWAWWAAAVASGLGFLLALADLPISGPTWSGGLLFVVSTAVPVLLCHPDNRPRLDGPVPELQSRGRSAAAIEDLYR